MLALQTARPGAQRRHTQSRRVVDKEFQRRQPRLAWTNLSKSSWLTSPRRMRSEETPDFLGEDPGGELLGRHLERKETDDRSVLGGFPEVGDIRGPISSRCIKCDVGGQRRFAHRRSAGEDDQIRGVQAAQLAVEIDKPGGDPDGFAAALEGCFGVEDRICQRGAKGAKTALGLPGGCEFEQLSLTGSICSRAGSSRSRETRR